MISKEQLLAIMPLAGKRADVFLDPLNRCMYEFDITTPLREAAFLAQVAHESGQLRYVKELASGKAYEGRADLGDTKPGDGVKYKGRGLIQITGKINYEKCGVFLGLDLLTFPELLETPVNACRSAGWFWMAHGLGELADKEQFRSITRKINGGLNGIQEREAYYTKACAVLETED